MNATAPLCTMTIAVALAACEFAETPTKLSVPQDAIEVRQVSFAQGRAHQTYFTLKAAYPDDRALEHYMKAIPEPWVRCDWAPEWQSFLDGTVKPVRTVHQQLHVWLNRDARRMLALSMKYNSPSDCAPRPLNDEQQVVLVEYLGADVNSEIQRLKLSCPARQVRSNSTPHAGAREAPRVASGCGARAGGRER